MATSNVGKQIVQGDEVTILGYVSAISGTGSKASVTVLDKHGNSFVTMGRDCSAPQTEGPALSRDGKKFSVGDPVTIPGTSQSIVGTGGTALVTTVLPTSGTTVKHTAASAAAPHKH